MKVLLDECVPQRFKSSLNSPGVECVTVAEAGFVGKTNGELLRLAEAQFDVFVTLDKGFAFQPNLSGRKIDILLVRAQSSRLTDINRQGAASRQAIAEIKPGELIQIGDKESLPTTESVLHSRLR
jgi:predicted nuclease of predicted toxin-antitoxin system